MESFVHAPRGSLHGAELCLCEAGNGLLQDWAWSELGNPALGAKGYWRPRWPKEKAFSYSFAPGIRFLGQGGGNVFYSSSTLLE